MEEAEAKAKKLAEAKKPAVEEAEEEARSGGGEEPAVEGGGGGGGGEQRAERRKRAAEAAEAAESGRRRRRRRRRSTCAKGHCRAGAGSSGSQRRTLSDAERLRPRLSHRQSHLDDLGNHISVMQLLRVVGATAAHLHAVDVFIHARPAFSAAYVPYDLPQVRSRLPFS